MQNETFNEQDSLRVITEMIHKTKNEVIKKDFNAFLFYGYAVLFTSAVTYITIFDRKSKFHDALGYHVPTLFRNAHPNLFG